MTNDTSKTAKNKKNVDNTLQHITEMSTADCYETIITISNRPY